MDYPGRSAEILGHFAQAASSGIAVLYPVFDIVRNHPADYFSSSFFPALCSIVVTSIVANRYYGQARFDRGGRFQEDAYNTRMRHRRATIGLMGLSMLLEVGAFDLVTTPHIGSVAISTGTAAVLGLASLGLAIYQGRKAREYSRIIH